MFKIVYIRQRGYNGSLHIDITVFYYPLCLYRAGGLAILSSILNSKRAVAVNIQIMRIFTRIRQMLTDNAELPRRTEIV